MEAQIDLQKQFREKQEKYVYYIIALCVAAIGFSVTKTSGDILRWSQLPLGIAVLCWGLSIYCGLKFIAYVLSNLFANNAYLDVLSGRHPQVGVNPDMQEAASVASTPPCREMENEWLFYKLFKLNYFTWECFCFYYGMFLKCI